MARIIIANTTREDKGRNQVHDIARATYTTFTSDNDVFFQIDTYGRSRRNHPEKISQSIQLDRNSAILLIDILKREFSL